MQRRSAILMVSSGLILAWPGGATELGRAQDSQTQAGQSREPRRLPAGQALLDFVNRVKPAVVMVIMTNEAGGEVASATGVMLDGGFVLVPRDVAIRGPKGRIMLSNEQALEIETVAAASDETGLAHFSFVMPPHLDQSVLEVAALATEERSAGDEVLAVSSPLGRLNYAATPGRIVAGAGDAASTVELSLPPRSNGSPVVNALGEVVGMAIEREAGQYAIVPSNEIISLAVEAAESDRIPLATFHEAHAPASASEATEREAEKLEATIEKRPDGSMLVDREFIIRGSGSKENPYRITWDLLISAARQYEPRAGRTQLPERITMLDGKWVELPGYLAFPLVEEASDELLLMLNQWDGCCIGVPPTPYDAVEVTLVAPYKGEAGINIFNYGTVHGRLEVDPYVTNGWLIGLYLMEEATLSFDE